MKISEIPPTPPEPKYCLELTKDQLIALGFLSFRHEMQTSGFSTFYRNLPEDLKISIVNQTKSNPQFEKVTTTLVVDWDA